MPELSPITGGETPPVLDWVESSVHFKNHILSIKRKCLFKGYCPEKNLFNSEICLHFLYKSGIVPVFEVVTMPKLTEKKESGLSNNLELAEVLHQ